jgi:hypothetical protein
MKDITGFGTTDEEFEALPIAVRRKVHPPFKLSKSYQPFLEIVLLLVEEQKPSAVLRKELANTRLCGELSTAFTAPFSSYSTRRPSSYTLNSGELHANGDIPAPSCTL